MSFFILESRLNLKIADPDYEVQADEYIMIIVAICRVLPLGTAAAL